MPNLKSPRKIMEIQSVTTDTPPPLASGFSRPTFCPRGPMRLRIHPIRPFGGSHCMSLQGGYAMRPFDLTPFYRSTVGFDRLFSLLDQGGLDSAPSYPPYNIERTGE